uniref:Uncharacterized protein n=1 Tax=Sphaerodactylus townsendi TaxID=933632 RepID=A0ACB8FX47_9SAUR
MRTYGICEVLMRTQFPILQNLNSDQAHTAGVEELQIFHPPFCCLKTTPGVICPIISTLPLEGSKLLKTELLSVPLLHISEESISPLWLQSYDDKSKNNSPSLLDDKSATLNIFPLALPVAKR